MRRIRLTESELISFIKQVIKESKYSHDFQSYEDSILDKISDEGIETLSDIEKYIYYVKNIPYKKEEIIQNQNLMVQDFGNQ